MLSPFVIKMLVMICTFIICLGLSRFLYTSTELILYLIHNLIPQVIDKNLGRKIKGQIDHHERDIIFTEAFVNRKKAQIRGALSAATVYVYCANHLTNILLSILIFFNIELSDSKMIYL